MANLMQIAELDNAILVEDVDSGFGWSTTLISPYGVPLAIDGLTNDIGAVIDPDTGQAVSGREASVTYRLKTILDAGFSYPRGISKTNLKPWVVKFNDLYGAEYTFKITESKPDRTSGVITCMLEAYID